MRGKSWNCRDRCGSIDNDNIVHVLYIGVVRRGEAREARSGHLVAKVQEMPTRFQSNQSISQRDAQPGLTYPHVISLVVQDLGVSISIYPMQDSATMHGRRRSGEIGGRDTEKSTRATSSARSGY